MGSLLQKSVRNYQVKEFVIPIQTHIDDIQGRSVVACQNRFDYVLGLGFPAFSEDENATLILLAANGASLEEMVQALPGRTVTMCRYHLLQLKSQGQMTAKATGHAIVRKKRPKKNNGWTDQEDLLVTSLRDHGMSFRQISKYLPCRSANACSKYHRKYKTKSPGGTDDQNIIDDISLTPTPESEVQFRANSHTSKLDDPRDGHIPILIDTQSSNLAGPDRQSKVSSTNDTVAAENIIGYSSGSKQEDPHPFRIRDVAESRYVDLGRQFWAGLSNGSQEVDVQESDAQEGHVQEGNVQESDLHVQGNGSLEMGILDQLRITHPPQAKHSPPTAVKAGQIAKEYRSDLRKRLQHLPEDIASIKKRISQWHGTRVSSEERAQLNDCLRGEDANATGEEVGEDETNAHCVPVIRIEDVGDLEGRVTVRNLWGL